MAKPSSPELARSGHTPVDPDAPASTAPLEPDVGTTGAAGHLGPVPPDNRPARTDGDDEDKPNLAAFARRLGIRRRPADDEQAPSRDAGDEDLDDRDQSDEPTWRRLVGAPAGAASMVLRAMETALRRSADLTGDLADKMGDRDRDS